MQLSRIYHDPQFEPGVAELVMVHMVLAIIKYQLSARNPDSSALDSWLGHYQYAVSFVYELVESHKLQDIQAMTLICSLLRSFQKPGAAWIMCHNTLGLAMEMGLHRSVRAWTDMTPKRDPHEVEMRKRVFWSLMCIFVSLSGKLGRPMPIRIEDIDVEIPDPIPDCLPSETMLTDFRKCSFRVGIEVAKLVTLFIQVYSSVYIVRNVGSPRSYEVTVRRLEAEIRKWRNQIPNELQERTVDEDRVFDYCLQTWEAEFHLLLHHPALCQSDDPDFINSNMDVCLDAASKMLQTVNKLRNLKSLDTTWLSCTVYLAAIFTTLFVYSQRKDELTSSQMISLKTDMELWLEVMGDVGIMLGT